MDLERNIACSVILLVWSAVLLGLSTMALPFKLLCFASLLGFLVYHTRRRHLTYEIVFTCLVATGLLAMANPAVLLQTVFLVYGLLLLATLCLFLSVETLFLVLLGLFAVVYSLLLTISIATRTDPAFTALFLLSLTSVWLGVLRPVHRNAV